MFLMGKIIAYPTLPEPLITIAFWLSTLTNSLDHNLVSPYALESPKLGWLLVIHYNNTIPTKIVLERLKDYERLL